MKKVVAEAESTKEKDISTEEKIKAAALKLFHKKGYAGTKARDIAKETGMNIALLNYYFRSKKKLFEIIMEESFHRFFIGIRELLERQDIGVGEKLQGIAERYIDMLLENPHLPLFLLGEMQADNAGFTDRQKIQKNIVFREIANAKPFVRQFAEELCGENPMQILINIVSMSVFPFAAKPFLMLVGGMDEEAFVKFVEERKKLIPEWIEGMLNKDKQKI